MAKSKKKGGGGGASPPPSPQVDSGDGDVTPPETEVAPEDAAAQIAQLQAQLGAVQKALIQSESRVAATLGAPTLESAWSGGASGRSAPPVPTPSPPPGSSHAPPSEPPVTSTEIKVEGNGGPTPETMERAALEGLIQGSDLPPQEVEFLVREAGRVGGSGTQSGAAVEGREDAIRDTHRVPSAELQRARRAMSTTAGPLSAFSTLGSSEFARGERETAFLPADGQNKVIAQTLLHQYKVEIHLRILAQNGESREEEPNKWLKGDSLQDILYKASAAGNLLETGHKEDITAILVECNLYAYATSRMAAVHEIVMQDVFFITNEWLPSAVVWYLRAKDYQCVELWGMIKFENLKLRDDRMRQVEEILILMQCPGGHDAASHKLSETGKDWLVYMCESNTFTEALNKATESYRADVVLSKYYDIDLPPVMVEISRMLRHFINLDSKSMNKSKIGQEASRDLVPMVRKAIETIKSLQENDLEASFEMYRLMGDIDFNQGLVAEVNAGKPVKRPYQQHSQSLTGYAAAATDRGRDSTPRGGGGGRGNGGDGWTYSTRGRSQSRGAPDRFQQSDCWVCKKSDHQADGCPKLASEFIYPGDDGRVLDVQCHACKQIGHYKGECPGPNAIRKIEAGYIKKEREATSASANRASVRHTKKEKKKSSKSARRGVARRPPSPKAAEEPSTEEDSDSASSENTDRRQSWYEDSDTDSSDNTK